MIIDCILLDSELSMLEFRMKMLWPLVSRFVIVEADKTFSGHDKPFHFAENKDRFDWAKEKIVHFPAHIEAKPVTDKPDKYDPTHECWKVEHEQRNLIVNACAGVNDNSFVLMGDVDEIPSREALQELKNRVFPGIVTFKMAFFYYNLTCLRNEIWNGTVWTPIDALRKFGAQKLRDSRGGTGFDINNAGWHLSYVGGVKKIQDKIRNFSHQEYATDEFMDAGHIEKCIADGGDLFKRGTPSRKVERDFFPPYFQENVTEEIWWA